MSFEDAAIDAYRRAVVSCALAPRVRAALATPPRLGIAVGKAALDMARGAAVERGLAIAPTAGPVPPNWDLLLAPHPDPDERSVAAGRAVRALAASSTPGDSLVALISGGASSLLEEPRCSLEHLRATIASLRAAGAPIRELNTVRGALSTLKAGGLALATPARVITLVASDVVGDPLDVIGSGPTIGPWLGSSVPVDVGAAAHQRASAARAILARYGIPAPPVLDAPLASRLVARPADRALLVAPLAAFADAVLAVLPARRLDPPLEGDVEDAAARIVAAVRTGPVVAWGEPTVRLPPDHGTGGRAQQLALLLARSFRHTAHAALVAGTDGIDGPGAIPAGAFVDGATWDVILAAGIDPAAALARCASTPALLAADRLFSPGPTGVNHADIVIAR